ncbi:MAG: GGDEF domain-containing protein, partial [Acidovorax sp.]
LTNTLNRRALLQRCEDELERAHRYGQGPSIMMLDLDNFKAVNDTHGHQHGDAVLVHFTDSTRQVLRRQDRLGRYGGEEFMVLLPGADTAAAAQVAQRIHAALAAGHPLDCQVSIGVASWQGPGETLDAMLSRADAALYRAKEQGRNRTVAA